MCLLNTSATLNALTVSTVKYLSVIIQAVIISSLTRLHLWDIHTRLSYEKRMERGGFGT
jgi:hypothetical protein